MPASVQTIEGRPTWVVETDHGLPRTLEGLLSEMAPFRFTYRDDPVLGGMASQCEALRTHRFVRFREGRWFARRSLHIRGTGESVRVVPAGVLDLALQMCADCGAVCVRDVTREQWAGARPARIVNLRTGEERITQSVARRDVVIGWYSGKRRGGREYR